MDKTSQLFVCLTYTFLLLTTMTSSPQPDWQAVAVIGLIASVCGNAAILYFFFSNKRHIDAFINEPSVKNALTILILRRKKQIKKINVSKLQS